MTPLPPFRARVGRALLLGLPGVAALPFLVAPPPGVPTALLMLNPLLLLVLASLAGAWAAPRVGIASAVVLGGPLRGRALSGALLAGLALGAAVALADAALAPLWRGEARLPPTLLAEAASPGRLMLGILYGGFTEEVMMRWGLLTVLAAGLLRLLPRRAALGAALALAALAFAAAHAPALLAAGAEPTPGFLARTLGLNALLGLAFGAALLRGGLEAAIALHAAFHLGAAGAAALA